MTKEEILDRVDKMIDAQQNHINWLGQQKLGKIGNFLWPETNRLIDDYINGNYTHLHPRDVNL